MDKSQYQLRYEGAFVHTCEVIHSKIFEKVSAEKETA